MKSLTYVFAFFGLISILGAQAQAGDLGSLVMRTTAGAVSGQGGTTTGGEGAKIAALNADHKIFNLSGESALFYDLLILNMPKLKAAEDADKKNGNEEATKEFYASMRERARIMYDNGETIHETLIKEVPRQVSQEAMAYNLKTDNSGAGVR